MSTRLVAFAVAAFALAATATAQFAGPGLSWVGTSGSAVRGFVPSCANLPVTAIAGETVSLSVWGDVQAPFALFIAPSASQCRPLPGLGNALILDMPFATLSAGLLTRTTPCLSCPPGYEDLRLTIPPALPPGLTASFQALSFGAGRPALTVAITCAIR